LTDQIIRASRSIPANIAEGFGRFRHQENFRFCRIARGSLYETLEHIICAFDENYITGKIYRMLRNQFTEVLKLLNGYIVYLKKSKSIQQLNNFISVRLKSSTTLKRGLKPFAGFLTLP